MIAALALALTFAFPPLPPFLLRFQAFPSLADATGWRLYAWNARWSIYCECELEQQDFLVSATRDGDRVTVTLPAGLKPGTRNVVLVPLYGQQEGSGSTVQEITIP